MCSMWKGCVFPGIAVRAVLLRNTLLSPRLLRWGNAFNLSLKVPLAVPMCSGAGDVFWEWRVRILKACIQLFFWQAASAVLLNTREEQCSEHPCWAKPEKVSMEQINVTFSIQTAPFCSNSVVCSVWNSKAVVTSKVAGVLCVVTVHLQKCSNSSYKQCVFYEDCHAWV